MTFFILVSGVHLYRIANEWLYKLAGLTVLLEIPIFLIECKVYTSEGDPHKVYCLAYSTLIVFTIIGFGVSSNLVAVMNRLKPHPVWDWLIIVSGLLIIMCNTFSDVGFEIVKTNGMYVYNGIHPGNHYILYTFFGLTQCVRSSYIGYKVLKQSAITSKRKVAKQFFLIQTVFTIFIAGHFMFTVSGFPVFFGCSIVFLVESVALGLHYNHDRLNDPRLDSKVMIALDDSLNNYIVLDKHYIIIDMNIVASDTMQLDFQDIVNKSMLSFLQNNFLVNEDRIAFNILQDCLERGSMLNVHNQDQSLYLDILSQPCISGNGGKTGYLLQMTDVTLSQKNKLLFEATQELQKQMLIIAHFSNTISHDIKTPVMEIEMNISNAHATTLEDYEKLIFNIQTSLGQLKMYVEQSLEYSLNSKRLTTSTPVKSTQLFSHLKVLFRYILAERNIEYVVTGEIEFVQNKLLLEQLFINLINNTLKHNYYTHKLLIRIALTSANNKNIIVYTDNGVGIPANKKEEIFRTKSAGDSFAAGNIGLPLCKKIIDMMDGNITETGVFGHGAAFLIKLPV